MPALEICTSCTKDGAPMTKEIALLSQDPVVEACGEAMDTVDVDEAPEMPGLGLPTDETRA